MEILQVGIGLILVLPVFLGFAFLTLKMKNESTTTWFVPHKGADKNVPSWQGVYKILTEDPLLHSGEAQTLSFESKGNQISIVQNTAIMFAFLTAIIIIIGVLLVLVAGSSGDLEKYGYLGWFIGIVYGGATFIVTTRVRVQSTNRMKWIDNLRDTIVDAIALAPGGDERSNSPKGIRCCETVKSSESARLRIETLLNPEEPDHRTLGLLIRHIHGVYVKELDDPIIKSLDGIDGEYPYMERLNISERDRSHGVDRDKMVMWAIRLSDAILKREWERVKRAA